MASGNKKLLISIFVYILFALLYWNLRKTITMNYGETGNFILLIFLVALSYVFYNTYYRLF